MIEPGQRLVLRTPGGGGLGDPRDRSAASVADDVQNDLISPEAALAVYGHAV